MLELTGHGTFLFERELFAHCLLIEELIKLRKFFATCLLIAVLIKLRKFLIDDYSKKLGEMFGGLELFE